MKILYASDIHESSAHLDSLLAIAKAEKADCVILGGDIIPKSLHETFHGVNQLLLAQAKYLAEKFIPVFQKFKNEKPDVKVYLDMANDDFIANRYILEEQDGELFNLLHMRKQRLTPDMDIIGYMFVPITPFGIKDWEKPDTEDFPCASDCRANGIKSSAEGIREVYLDLYSEDTIQNDMNILSGMVDKPFIFVSHSPPYGTQLDMLYNRQPAGSRAIRSFIEKWAEDGRLNVSLHGHIHESPQVSGKTQIRIDDTLCINPGQHGNKLAYHVFEAAG